MASFDGNVVFCRGVSFAYKLDMEREIVLEKPVPALHDVNLSLPSQSRCVVVGSNGAGKSTLLRLLAGRHRADDGEVNVPREVAYVSTESWGSRTNANLNVGELLDGARHRAADVRGFDEMSRVLRLDLLRRHSTRGLSDGELRRVQLSIALANSPKLVLLDESCVELDVVVRADFLALLKRRRVACLYATHVFDGLNSWPTHFVVVDKGTVKTVTALDREQTESAVDWIYRQAVDRNAPSLANRSHVVDDGQVALAVDAARWSYDPRGPPALDGASLSVPTAARVVVVGANGSGKSTMLALAAGARLDSTKSFRVFGVDPSATNLRASGRVALLGGSFRNALDHLLPYSSSIPFAELMKSALEYHAQRGVDPDVLAKRAATLIADLEVDPKWTPAKSSSGQRTRMQLALQLAPPADLYVLDELTRDLDLRSRNSLLVWLSQQPATVLYATHILQGLQGWATHVAHFAHGAVGHFVAVDDLKGRNLVETVEAWLRIDDAETDQRQSTSRLSGEGGSSVASAQVPVGWGKIRRDNTLEASFGSHTWSAQAAHGRFADLHSTPHQNFSTLYLGERRS